MLVPRQSALYFRNMPNIPHPTSLIDWESLWFFIILLTAKSSTQSIPTVVFVSMIFLAGITSFVSVSIETKYFPAGVLLSVALLIIPLISRCKTILIPFLNFGIQSQPFSIVIFCGQRKDCLPDRVLKLGNLPRPLKKLAYAISRLSKAACKDWLLTSLSQVQSCFKSFNCTCKSYLERFILCAEYAHVFVSKARLKTNLTLPKCLSSNSFCESDGYKRYLFAFSTIQRFNILTNMNIFLKFGGEANQNITTAKVGGFLRIIKRRFPQLFTDDIYISTIIIS